MQKNKNRAPSSKELGSIPQAPPAPVDHLSYDDTEGDYFPSYFEVEPSGASDTACHGEGGQQPTSGYHIGTYYDQQRVLSSPDGRLALSDARNKDAFDNVVHRGSAPWDR